jgi:hypothetical protein
LVLSDLERHCVIAVLPERSKERLACWFADLSTAERKAIRVVSIDMWEPYRRAVQAMLPHAQLVADRFHVMKQLNDRLTQMRRSIQRQADEATRQVLKGSRWLLVNNRNQLTPEEETRLQEVLAASPELRTVYLLKEEFRTICEKSQDRRQAERFLRAWLWKAEHTGDRFLLKFVKTLRNWCSCHYQPCLRLSQFRKLPTANYGSAWPARAFTPLICVEPKNIDPLFSCFQGDAAANISSRSGDEYILPVHHLIIQNYIWLWFFIDISNDLLRRRVAGQLSDEIDAGTFEAVSHSHLIGLSCSSSAADPGRL